MKDALEAAARELGLDLSENQLGQLLAYLALLQKWNKVYNLTAVRDPEQMLTHHLVDSLSVIAPLQRHGAPARLMDVGAGGGLPGVVIAVCCPRTDVSCVDAVAKKATFIQQVAAELRLPNLHGVHSRVEMLETEPFGVITSRAFASLVDFTSLTRRHVAEGAIWMAMKGHHPTDEIAALPTDVDVFHVEQLAVPGLDARRCIVWMRPR
ncbi:MULTISPECIES: 16S rRNA (guanine(527)-N(7))-methyltransferase RsmG [unclassified Roseateles]|uniref:16S rRNA (guanine(527)-N(7))-methyltransferase RsmG n=1 Tax=unclassified Roseateles TaxID=2626991 RepID=UPI0006FE6AF5|nr:MULTISPECIES: 16S rRNA (guanine(527)-N(7))-methyltransferase RsmG [unclassified Roseateles]KQW45445.1 16S rRNA (guanine(527)-N(7))-methyltransferase RsmG [Pelomonas sp. Root405]KRA72289.1 16S rRNA (guanine(527)-N(7))-methyltransferase RsmG [Pelomonas sp. Root662]